MTGTSFSYPIFEAIRARNSVFSDVLGFADADQPMNLNAAGLSGLAKGEYVSGNYFSTLGVSAALGRTILPSDDKTGAAPIAVISYAYWTSRFGRDSSVVGKAITVNGVPFTLVGVAAPEFWGLSPGVRPTPGYPSRRTCWWIRAGACRRTARSWRPTDRGTEHRRFQVTAGGLVFIGASYDGRFRGFNKDTGKELWVAKLPASGFATPMTFRARKSGKQYVVIAAGGGNKYDKHFSDALVAYALPRVALSTVEGTASGGKDREVIEGFTQVLTGSRSAWISPSFVVPGDE